MDQSYSDNELCLSPTQILERLQVLRQLQLLQRGKLQKQRLEYQETSENSSGFTEIVSHFSSSTSSNILRSLLQSPREDNSNSHDNSNVSSKVNERDLIEGVSVLNLSQESEFIIKSPNSLKSQQSGSGKVDLASGKANSENVSKEKKSLTSKHIALDDMPILSPKKDFEALIIEKLKSECAAPIQKIDNKKNENNSSNINKRPFLRRGEGMARFGLRKNDLVIQNTKSLPWRNQNFKHEKVQTPKRLAKKINKKSEQAFPSNEPEPKPAVVINRNITTQVPKPAVKEKPKSPPKECNHINSEIPNSISSETCANKPSEKVISVPKLKHPLIANKGKTWAAVLTKEQNDFLTQLKQIFSIKRRTELITLKS